MYVGLGEPYGFERISAMMDWYIIIFESKG